MVNIVKSDIDPVPLADFKANKAAMNPIQDCHYEDFQNPNRNLYKIALLKEQYYLCAYCNRRLDEYETEDKIHQLKIEHWYPQALCKREIEYKTLNGRDIAHENMLIVCPGKNVNPDFSHCDTSRNESVTLTIQPQHPTYLFQNVFTYEGGELKTEDAAINIDVNVELNLNESNLIKKRNIVLDQFRKLLPANKAMINKAALIHKYSTVHDNKRLTYCTLILHFVENKL